MQRAIAFRDRLPGRRSAAVAVDDAASGDRLPGRRAAAVAQGEAATEPGIAALRIRRSAGGMGPRNRTAGRSELRARPAWDTPSPRARCACPPPGAFG